MNQYHHPGVGNQQGQQGQRGQHGHPGQHGHYGQQGYGQASSHRQGQSQLGQQYNGLHGGFQYNGDMTPPPQTANTQSLLPSIVPHSNNQLIETDAMQSKKGIKLGNLGTLPNLTEIKGFVDRMGGLDGILSTVTKVQKVMGSVTQMAPMVKVLMGSFGKKSISEDDENNSEWKPRRRRRRRRPASSARPRPRQGGSSGRRRRRRPGRRR
ncbi:hypothetical protein [Paenibacillus sp. HB172176]|uniref:hypothetical protein n=1 Tax=Paenibacillus sp. HB172176 TaxID=2493690 RepID=UPI001439307C|nr:hypothetical protein [Paenibacillus sp. HB172176]